MVSDTPNFCGTLELWGIIFSLDTTPAALRSGHALSPNEIVSKKINFIEIVNISINMITLYSRGGQQRNSISWNTHFSVTYFSERIITIYYYIGVKKVLVSDAVSTLKYNIFSLFISYKFIFTLCFEMRTTNITASQRNQIRRKKFPYTKNVN